VVLWRSVKDPDVPKKKGIVRANMGTSGFVITPLQSNSLVTLVLQFDLKGWVPSGVINQVVASHVMLINCVENQLKKISGASSPTTAHNTKKAPPSPSTQRKEDNLRDSQENTTSQNNSQNKSNS